MAHAKNYFPNKNETLTQANFVPSQHLEGRGGSVIKCLAHPLPDMLMLMSSRFTMSEINSGLHKPGINKGLVKSNS